MTTTYAFCPELRRMISVDVLNQAEVWTVTHHAARLPFKFRLPGLAHNVNYVLPDRLVE